MKRFELIGLGECMVEFFAAEPLEQAKHFERRHAGDVLNTLVMAARLGSRAGLISRVGADPFAAGLRQFWESEAVDSSATPTVAGDNGIYFISLDASGERSFTYRRQHSAASGISPSDLNFDYIASSQMLLVSGITQAISESAQATTLKAAQMAQQCGTRVAYDPNYRPSLWAMRGGLEAARQAYHELLPLVDVLLPSSSDLQLLEIESESNLKNLPSPIIALKAANAGVYLKLGAMVTQIAASPARIADSTGAGDAWNGAFLHGLANLDAPEAATRANRIAALTLEFRGAIPAKETFLPRLKELL